MHEKYGPELQYTFVRCLECGLVYQNPRPKYDEIFLKDAYEIYEGYIPDYVYTEKSLDGWEKELREILKYDGRKSAVLDIGVCMGDFLKVSQKYYAICRGIDVASNMAKFVETNLKIKVYIGSFPDMDFNEKYSCVHMSHVIEHIPDPNAWLEKAREIMEPNGILAVSVPNSDSLPRRFRLFLKRCGIIKGKWKDSSRTPDHLFEPNIPSFIRLINKNGFRILDYYSYSRRDMSAKTFFDRIYNRKLKLGSNLRFLLAIN
jgi:SAM-dependent methyltransferase